MALSDLVVRVLSTAGPVGLTYMIMRNFSQVTRALLTVLAVVVAMFARDGNRRQCGREVLEKLMAQDGKPTGRSARVTMTAGRLRRQFLRRE